MPQTTPISKIQLIDGTVVDLSNILYVILPDGSQYNVNWNIANFSGNVSLIGDADYLLAVPNYQYEYKDISGSLNQATQTLNGTTLAYDSISNGYTIDKPPTANTSFRIYENGSAFPEGLKTGDLIVFGSGSGISGVSLYVGYSTDGSTFTNFGSSYSTTTYAHYVIPANATGLRIIVYVAKTASFSDITIHPFILIPNT